MTDACLPSSSAVAPGLMQALGHPLSDRRLQVLKALSQCGSISQAARQVGVSYKAAWQAIDTLGNLAGVPVVEKSVGGAGGGGARLTAAGQELLRAAEAMAQVRGAVMQQLQSPLPVHRLNMQTSMRNQWPAVVQEVQVAGALAQVVVHSVAGQWPATARITAESAQLLGLQPGTAVIAMCKATAVTISAPNSTRVPSAAMAVTPARVERVHAGDWGDEVAVTLDCGLQLVGFGPANSGWQPGQAVVLELPPAALVLALEGL